MNHISHTGLRDSAVDLVLLKQCCLLFPMEGLSSHIVIISIVRRYQLWCPHRLVVWLQHLLPMLKLSHRQVFNFSIKGDLEVFQSKLISSLLQAQQWLSCHPNKYNSKVWLDLHIDLIIVFYN